MTFKSILFCLFLYVCLVWVGAYYLYSGEKVQQVGLLWTGAGLLAVLLLILVSRLIAWWRLWRVRAAAKPVSRQKAVESPAKPVPEDDAALLALIQEANAVLARTKAYASRPEAVTLASFPSYLLVGPEGVGKTSTFLESGLEPQLLAGQVIRPGVSGPTRTANIWLAKEQIFFELAGRSFSGDLATWQRLLRLVQAKPEITRWQRFWNEPAQGLDLRGVIAFCDVKEFTAAVSPQGRERLETQIRHWQERLGAIAEVFGIECPVHVLVTQCDSIPYFPDYFRRVPESETGQILGNTLPVLPVSPDGVWQTRTASAEAESKWLTKSFNSLYYLLADKRLDRLAHEPDPARRPAIYEFPRELKRIRGPLVQFLTTVFRPHPLRPGAQLRGYYFSGTVEREMAATLADSRSDSRTNWKQPSANLEATNLFRSEATQIMRGGADAGAYPKSPAAGPLVRRWLFVKELFSGVIPADFRPRAARIHSRSHNQRRLATIVVCAACALLCCAFLASWMGNLGLLHSLHNETPLVKKGSVPSLAELQSLDDLRGELNELARYEQDGAPLHLRWGLYSGNGLLEPMRQTYFRRFQDLLLNNLNGTMVAALLRLPAQPGPHDEYSPVFRLLKTHLMISSGVCQPEPPLVAAVLKETRAQSMPVTDVNWQSLADRQIDFYAAQLRSGNPCKLAEHAAARDRARTYLANIQGVDRLYAGLLADARRKFPNPQRLSDLAPEYRRALNGPAEIDGIFSRDGWSYFEKIARSGKAGSAGETCALGGQTGPGIEATSDRETQRALQRLFLHDYAEHWRKYVTSFSVNRYSGPYDAARKLDLLSGHKSPLLALLALTSSQTTFPQASVEPDAIDRVKPIVQKYFPKLGAGAQAARKAAANEQKSRTESASPADLTREFQPVHYVVPAASETWVSDKNSAYVDALAALGHAMDDIARAGANPEPAVFQAAMQNYDKALDAARQIARGFQPLGVAGLDVTVERLLEAPIRQTQAYIITDLSAHDANKINAALRQLCERAGITLRKYPFQRSGVDATLDEVAGLFAPATGVIWKFQAQCLADFLIKEGGRWQVKDPAKKPQVTPEMVNFLNRAQAVADAFYPAGSTQPQFTYTLRPRLDASFKDAELELEVDGQTHVWNSSLQKQFVWPPAPGAKEIGVRGRIRVGNLEFPFTSQGGVWAIFRVMADAEPRAISSRLVEWKYVRGGDGRLEAIRPAPVRLEFVDFPGGVDIFNPKFLQGLDCPLRAVQ